MNNYDSFYVGNEEKGKHEQTTFKLNILKRCDIEM